MTKKRRTKTFEFGDKVKDIVTEVAGVIIGHCKYVTGCEQYLIQPIASKKADREKGKVDGIWFDDMRLTKTGVDQKTKGLFEEGLSKDQPGADIAAPIK